MSENTPNTPENIAAVAERNRERASTSVHRRSQQLNFSETSLRRILHKALGYDTTHSLGIEAN